MNGRRAVALFSGGLDSRLAALLVARQGIAVTLVHFVTGFAHVKGLAESRNSRISFSRKFGLELREISIEDEFLGIIENPRFGWGKNLNPCVDCKIMMLRKARTLLSEIEADFIVSGEVLAQRPMSQHGPALRLIEKEGGLTGLLLRPLSARLLPSTIPEEQGWIDRDRLGGFSGRSRKPQMNLARIIGLAEYPPPAGGCLLTDRRFCDKLRDVLLRGSLTPAEVRLLKVGRHFRLSDRVKLVVARDEKEGFMLQELSRPDDWLFYPASKKGPLALARGLVSEAEETTAARLVGFYSRFPDGVPRVVVVPGGEEEYSVIVPPLSKGEMEVMRL
ncbi:MAG TPA: hypothetical protein VLH40_07535 [Atribacteraceae bacterium]|nr:hypothetical protein [Atribacteraceae bacterium]